MSISELGLLVSTADGESVGCGVVCPGRFGAAVALPTVPLTVAQFPVAQFPVAQFPNPQGLPHGSQTAG